MAIVKHAGYVCQCFKLYSIGSDVWAGQTGVVEPQADDRSLSFFEDTLGDLVARHAHANGPAIINEPGCNFETPGDILDLLGR